MAYTAKELCEKYKFTRAYVNLLVNGYKQTVKNGDKKYNYRRPPKFKENIHYYWDRGNLLFTDEAVKFIENSRQ